MKSNTIPKSIVPAQINSKTAQAVSEIEKLHKEIDASARICLQKAISIGEKLVHIKESMKHGHWGDWIKKNLPFTDRTAARYIKCYYQRDRLLKNDSMSNLGEAYALLTDPSQQNPDDGCATSGIDERCADGD